MFEETVWDSNEAHESLAKTLFQVYPKMKQKKKKNKEEKSNVHGGTMNTDETTPSNTPSGKVKATKKHEKTDINSHQKRKGKANVTKSSFDQSPAKRTSLVKKSQMRVKQNGEHAKKTRLKVTPASDGEVVKEENLNKIVTSKASKTVKHKQKKTSTTGVKMEETPSRSKQKKTSSTDIKMEETPSRSRRKNKYKSVIGDKKSVGLDVKAVKPLLDIPRKLKFTGIKVSSLNQAQVQEVINEMSSKKEKVKRKRKQSTLEHRNTTDEELDKELPKKKKRKQLKLSDGEEVDTSQKETGKGEITETQSIKSDLDSFIARKKVKGKREKVVKESEMKAGALTAKKMKKSAKSSPGQDNSLNRVHGKSRLNVSKLKSLLSLDKDSTTTKDGEESVTNRESQGNEKTDAGKVTKKQKKVEPVQNLKEKLESRLMSSRFRYLNEQLYTCTGEEALQMFEQDADAFHCYHQGFQCQVAKWPTNPVERVIEYLRARSANLVVADFGCGEAKVAQSVKNQVHSFDLVKVNGYVTVCDIKKVPLQTGSIDVAVFCLSLMGTNFTDFICEASRVLKTGGVLLIAEVTSRFERPTRFARKVEKLGFALEDQVRKSYSVWKFLVLYEQGGPLNYRELHAMRKGVLPASLWRLPTSLVLVFSTQFHWDQSNKMFIWFEFKKTGAVPTEERMPKLELAPCYYKRR